MWWMQRAGRVSYWGQEWGHSPVRVFRGLFHLSEGRIGNLSETSTVFEIKLRDFFLMLIYIYIQCAAWLKWNIYMWVQSSVQTFALWYKLLFIHTCTYLMPMHILLPYILAKSLCLPLKCCNAYYRTNIIIWTQTHTDVSTHTRKLIQTITERAKQNTHKK